VRGPLLWPALRLRLLVFSALLFCFEMLILIFQRESSRRIFRRQLHHGRTVFFSLYRLLRMEGKVAASKTEPDDHMLRLRGYDA
jgi:hypothetical protein